MPPTLVRPAARDRFDRGDLADPPASESVVDDRRASVTAGRRWWCQMMPEAYSSAAIWRQRHRSGILVGQAGSETTEHGCPAGAARREDLDGLLSFAEEVLREPVMRSQVNCDGWRCSPPRGTGALPWSMPQWLPPVWLFPIQGISPCGSRCDPVMDLRAVREPVISPRKPGIALRIAHWPRRLRHAVRSVSSISYFSSACGSRGPGQHHPPPKELSPANRWIQRQEAGRAQCR